MVRVVTKFDTLDAQDEPAWMCQQGDIDEPTIQCNHQTRFVTVALFHQHDVHGIPMRELEQRTAHIMHKTETATDAGLETQNDNT
jgi:hypothetical protein